MVRTRTGNPAFVRARSMAMPPLLAMGEGDS
jgi:hypothetical protein